MRLDTYRSDPEGFRRLLAWNDHLCSTLPPALRALIETRVSQINGCGFCLAMHTVEARQATVPQAKLDVVAAWRDSTSFTAGERAALALAEAMTRLSDGGRVSEEIWQAVCDSFDEPTIAVLVQVVALINAFNRINVTTERLAEDYYKYEKKRSSR